MSCIFWIVFSMQLWSVTIMAYKNKTVQRSFAGFSRMLIFWFSFFICKIFSIFEPYTWSNLISIALVILYLMCQPVLYFCEMEINGIKRKLKLGPLVPLYFYIFSETIKDWSYCLYYLKICMLDEKQPYVYHTECAPGLFGSLVYRIIRFSLSHGICWVTRYKWS